MNLTEFDVSNPYQATLVSSELVTPPDSDAEVRHLVLRLPSPDFDYIEGQSIGVLAPGPHDFGNTNHLRLYSIASPREGENGKSGTMSICVRRCFSIDDVSGERYPGKASNYLCDANPGDPIHITGPYGTAFQIPPDTTDNLLMIGMGTGIAPFRAFVKHIYHEHRGWQGKVRLFYGAQTGMELLYMNDVKKDFALYYDQESFRAFEALSPRPAYGAPPALDRILVENAQEILALLEDPKTYVYFAGLSESKKKFEQAMTKATGSAHAWNATRVRLIDEQRLAEILYD